MGEREYSRGRRPCFPNLFHEHQTESRVSTTPPHLDLPAPDHPTAANSERAIRSEHRTGLSTETRISLNHPPDGNTVDCSETAARPISLRTRRQATSFSCLYCDVCVSFKFDFCRHLERGSPSLLLFPSFMYSYSYLLRMLFVCGACEPSFRVHIFWCICCSELMSIEPGQGREQHHFLKTRLQGL